MDPNTLSMEQGKQFLKQCGIPQRDIDLMTEKYVVIASVEVLLRFPLLPGEDPTARCVSDKECQPSVDPTHTVSGRCGDQEERKSNNQLINKTNKKPSDVNQVAGHYIHHQPQRPSTSKSLEKERRPVGQRAPPAEEDKAGVKCKNCGAFGHTARSTRCPMKCWGGALPLHPLGSNREKENLKPTKPQQLWAPAPFKDNNAEQNQRHSNLPGHCLCKPTRKDPPCALFPQVSHLLKTPETRSFFSSCHNKTLELSASGPSKGHERGFTDSPDPALKCSSQDPTVSARQGACMPEVFSGTVLQPSMRPLAPGPVFKPQAQIKRPDVYSKPRPQPVRQECGQDSTRRMQESGKKPVLVPIRTFPGPQKKAGLSFFPTPQLGTHRPDLGAVQALQPPCRTSGLGPSQAPKVTTKAAPTKEPTLQPPPLSPFLSPTQDRTVLRPGPSSHGAGQPSRAASLRCDQGRQSCRFRTASTSHAPGRATPAGQSPGVSTVSEGRGPSVPRSVLYEDLLVSSSSEDSDRE